MRTRSRREKCVLCSTYIHIFVSLCVYTHISLYSRCVVVVYAVHIVWQWESYALSMENSVANCQQTLSIHNNNMTANVFWWNTLALKYHRFQMI